MKKKDCGKCVIKANCVGWIECSGAGKVVGNICIDIRLCQEIWISFVK